MAMNENGTSQTPWKNGYYQSIATPATLFFIEGEKCCFFPASGKPTNLKDNPMLNGSVKHGDFGEAHPDIVKKTGIKRANIELTALAGMFKTAGVLTDDGKKITFYGFQHAIDEISWKSDEEIAKFKASGDPCDAMPHPYKMQPENQGKLLWLSGAPGLGKSTSGMLLGRKAGYVYYEADCFMNHLNPYVPIESDEPTLAMMSQKSLRGVSQKRIDTVADGVTHFFAMGEGKDYDFEKLGEMYLSMAEDVDKEQKRIGGDFAVAQAVPTRKMRDYIRSKLGSNLIFVVLHMSREEQYERIKARHGDEESFSDLLTKIYDVYEPATTDEPNSVNVVVTREMSRDEVVEEILRLVNK